MKKVLPWLMLTTLLLGGCSLSLEKEGAEASSSSSKVSKSSSSKKKSSSSSKSESQSGSSASSEEEKEVTRSFFQEGETDGIKHKNQLNITYKGDTYIKFEIDSTYIPSEEMKQTIQSVPYDQANAELQKSFMDETMQKLSQVRGVGIEVYLDQASSEIKSKISFDVANLDKATLKGISDYDFIGEMLDQKPSKIVLMLSLIGYKESTQSTPA